MLEPLGAISCFPVAQVYLRGLRCVLQSELSSQRLCVYMSVGRGHIHTCIHECTNIHTHTHTHTHIVKQFYSRSPLEVFEVLYTFTYTHIYSCFLICTHRIYIEGTKVQRVTWAKVSHGLKLLCLTYIDSVYIYICILFIHILTLISLLTFYSF